MSPSAPRVQCPFCLVRVRLTRDGVFYKHDYVPRRKQRCQGSGKTLEGARFAKDRLGAWMRDYQRGRRWRVAEVIQKAKRVLCTDYFDHNGSEKTVKLTDWARVVGTSDAAIERLREEIVACDVVCANCHRLRHSPKVRESGQPDSSDPTDLVQPEDIF